MFRLGFFQMIVFLGPLALAQPPTLMPLASLNNASTHARTDFVGGGYCGRGLWSVLSKLGYSETIRSADGQDWEEVLSKAGWIPWTCATPQLAPYGSVLVYLSDVRLHGKNLVGTQGGRFGHAELVAVENGQRVYVSDAPRPNAGGTVPANFTRRAWVPPGFSFLGNVAVSSTGALVPLSSLAAKNGGSGVIPNPPVLVRSQFDPVALRRNADGLVADRMAMSRVYFARH